MASEAKDTELEDAECLPENSSLNIYLRSLGYTDVEVTKKMSQSPRGIKFEVSKSKTKWPHVEKIDEDVMDQIGIIISTRLLFEEDILSLENLLSNFEVVKSGMLTSMFKGLFGVAVLFVGLCLYWMIGYYAIIIVSSFYAYNAARYLRRKYFYRIRLKKLSTIIQGNYILLRKTIKFIEENSLVESQCSSTNNSGEFIEGFDFYKNFKNDFLLSVKKMNNIFIKSTQKLIYKVPLYDYIENPEYYLCNNFKKEYESVNLSKLYKIYLLLQSEFLQRLILSLIPNIKLSTNDNFFEINEILNETCKSLLQIKKVISRKFRFLFFNGIHSPKPRVEFKLPKTTKQSENIYWEELMFNVHEISINFQNLLLKCRILEENINSEKKLETLSEEFAELHNKFISCRRNIDDCIILLNRSDATIENCDRVSVQEVKEAENSNETVNKIEVGYTDLDPKIEDDVFELFLANEKIEKNNFDGDNWDLDKSLQKKLEKEYSKNVIKELKVRLIEKAKSWKKREREVLKKKGFIDVNEDALDTESKSSENENPDELISESHKIPLKTTEHVILEDTEKEYESRNLTLSQNENQNNINVLEMLYDNNNDPENSEIYSNFQDGILSCQEVHTTFENTQNPMGSCKTDFFNDLNKAREKIFKSSNAIDEELFCDSGEEDSN